MAASGGAHHLVDYRADEPMTTLTAAATTAKRWFLFVSAEVISSHCQRVFVLIIFELLQFSKHINDNLQAAMEIESQSASLKPLIKFNLSYKLTPIVMG